MISSRELGAMEFSSKGKDSSFMDGKSGVLAKLLGALVTAISTFPSAMRFLFVMMALDYITGIVEAYVRHEIDSTTAKNGILKKFVVLLACSGGYVMTMGFSLSGIEISGLKLDFNIGSAMCGAFMVAEFISTMENVGRAGIRLPGPVRRILKKLKEVEK